MSIKLGNSNITLKVGSSAVTAAYLGSIQVYPNSIPPTPTFEGKFKAEYSNGTSYSAACDSSSSLTTATTQPSGYQIANMTDAIIGDCVSYIADYAFEIPNGQQSSLTSVTISDNVTTMGSYVFHRCKALTDIVMPNSVTTIGSNTFKECTSLSSVTLSNTLSNIYIGTFYNCYSLQNITVPSSVTYIDASAFYNCSGLTSIDIPSAVTNIGSQAFYGCINLTGITVNATTPPTLGSGAFYYTNDCPIYVPSESVETFKTAYIWNTYADRIQAIP